MLFYIVIFTFVILLIINVLGDKHVCRFGFHDWMEFDNYSLISSYINELMESKGFRLIRENLYSKNI